MRSWITGARKTVRARSLQELDELDEKLMIFEERINQMKENQKVLEEQYKNMCEQRDVLVELSYFLENVLAMLMSR
jgi:hypothetical protein